LTENLNRAVFGKPVYYGFVQRSWRELARDRRSSNCSVSVAEGSIHPFFRKPELNIEFDNEHPNTFTPSLQLIGQDGPTGITRFFLKVRVNNVGHGLAKRCRAKLYITSAQTRHPSDDKNLCWDSIPDRFIDIGAHDDELLNVMFTDSNFEARYEATAVDIFALASTLQSLHPEANFIPAQDGFGLADFRIRIRVRG
jgi:hypothetical protein